jgi:peroxiredoxin Q/BCP
MNQLKVGDKAPVFSLMGNDGEKHSLNDFKGKKVVLYFYPKDDTSGCTKEACSFRDNIALIRKKGAVVLGVSGDSIESHKKFVSKYDLNFVLLSNEDRSVLDAFGVWKEKSMYGRTFMGVQRTTFLIDEQGRISHIFPKVKVDGHTEEVLDALA